MNATRENDGTWRWRKAVMVAGIVVASGCGAHNAPDLAAYQQLLTQAGSVVAEHRAAGTQVTTLSNCTAEHSQYDGRMRSPIEQMKGMSGAMDDCMMSLGSSSGAGFREQCNSMSSELNAHAQAACQSTDLAQDWAETRRDCDAMSSLLDQEQNDITMMNHMMGGSMMSGGTCHP
jgi:hypothetical protein